MNIPIIAGVLASMLHVLSGPDHLAAVSPMVLNTSHKGWRIGFIWGVGHLTGMLIIGLVYLMLKNIIPFELVENISFRSEQLVGLVLICIGAWVFFRYFRPSKNHQHPHIHHQDNDSYIHIHSHTHDHAHPHDHAHSHKTVNPQTGSPKNRIYAFYIGVLHGFAGISHFLLLLPVLGFTSRFQSLQYIVGFGIGTVAGMSMFAILLGVVGNYFRKKQRWDIVKHLQFLGGLFAVVIGIYWIFS